MEANVASRRRATAGRPHGGAGRSRQAATSQFETVERRIQFYRVSVRPESDGSLREFDAAEAAKAIGELAFTPGGRYMDRPGGNALAIWPMSVPGQTRLGIGVIRRLGLPRIEDAGQVLPLSIAPNQGLVEQTHLVFFEKGIVGAEFNFYGPRPQRLADYLQEKLPAFPAISLDVLLNRDATEQIKHLRDVRLIDLKLRKDYVDVLSEANESIPGALRAVLDGVEAGTIEVVIRPPARHSLAQSALGIIRSLGGNSRVHEGAERFRVRGVDDRTDEVGTMDLLHDQLVVSRRVVRQDLRYRGIDAESMFEQINVAYDAVKDQLHDLLAVGE